MKSDTGPDAEMLSVGLLADERNMDRKRSRLEMSVENGGEGGYKKEKAKTMGMQCVCNLSQKHRGGGRMRS